VEKAKRKKKDVNVSGSLVLVIPLAGYDQISRAE
jgi:hypothetical protein